MKKGRAWHYTPFGRMALFLGSLRTAIPVLVLFTLSMVWGTWIESTQSAEAAKRVVYGSWWFIALMLWMSNSLIFAVVTRYPWQKRHVGFITVHAALITIIIGGFISLGTKVEGNIALREGMSSQLLEMPRQQVQWITGVGDNRLVSVAADMQPGASELQLGESQYRIVELWENCIERTVILNDGAKPFHAVEVAFDPHAQQGSWLGESESDQSAARVGETLFRVLPAGQTFEQRALPVGEPSENGEPFFEFESRSFYVGAAGSKVMPGWSIVSVQRFERAIVGEGGLREDPQAPLNRAIVVIISDGVGSEERHITFQDFPDLEMVNQVAGDRPSKAALRYPAQPKRRVVFELVDGQLRVVLEQPDGAVEEAVLSGAFPEAVQVDDLSFVIFQNFERAQARTDLVQAPAEENNLPVLVVQDSGDTNAPPLKLPWKGEVPTRIGGETGALRYGPAMHPLPFTVRLDDFRQTTYPGSDMAMSYESDVSVDRGSGWEEQRIWMNNPLEHDGWKVYQSSFIGDDISIFSVARDPGLPITYVGCILLVTGLAIIFYMRPYSWGHPGVPMLGVRQGERA